MNFNSQIILMILLKLFLISLHLETFLGVARTPYYLKNLKFLTDFDLKHHDKPVNQIKYKLKEKEAKEAKEEIEKNQNWGYSEYFFISQMSRIGLILFSRSDNNCTEEFNSLKAVIVFELVNFLSGDITFSWNFSERERENLKNNIISKVFDGQTTSSSEEIETFWTKYGVDFIKDSKFFKDPTKFEKDSIYFDLIKEEDNCVGFNLEFSKEFNKIEINYNNLRAKVCPNNSAGQSDKFIHVFSRIRLVPESDSKSENTDEFDCEIEN